MSTATPAIQKLARRLIAVEASRTSSDKAGAPAGYVCEKLRVPLAKLAGVAGFRSLLSRALALAAAETACLKSVQVSENGSLQRVGTAEELDETCLSEAAGIAIVTHLLGLLEIFIGESLTRQLVREAWPDETTDETDGAAGNQA